MSKRRISCLVLLLPTLFLCWLLTGFSFNLSGQSPLQKLESARKVWDEQNINDYKMTVAFGSFSYIGRFYFTIQDNQITQISTVRNVLMTPTETPVYAEDADILGYAKSFGSYGSFPASLNDYTIVNLFDFAAQKLASEPTMPLIAWCGALNNALRMEATFNSDLGYIQSFHHTDCPRWDVGGGLLCPAIPHCRAGFSILNFEPLQ
jgi:hypothetical protein